MRMTVNETEVSVDLITSVVDIGQLSALATKLNFTAIVEAQPDADPPSHRVRFVRVAECFGMEELVNLAVLYGYTTGSSGEAVALELRNQLQERHFPMDKPIQDVMEIGGGPDHEGH